MEITNYRCLQHVEIDWGEITTFIGPNGAGKSSILRAIDWFFNGSRPGLTDEDVYRGADAANKKIRVRVTFDQLTASDRDVLGTKYAPQDVDRFTAWRTWEGGNEKITGRALAFGPFEAVRAAPTAVAKREALARAIDAWPDLDLPRWHSVDATSAAMDEWERSYPDLLEDAEVSDTHFFGFFGQEKLSGLFDYVLVTADLRAREESLDTRTTIIGRILERAVDRQAANAAFRLLAEELTARQRIITEEHLAAQLGELSRALTEEVLAFTTGRTIQLRAMPGEVKQPESRIHVEVQDADVATSVDRQGHGFQRALLLSSLKLLASRGAKPGGDSVICLAIEEPELFQHPTQARVFADALRTLAYSDRQGIQIAYATHSPYFLDARHFDEIRRVNRRATGSGRGPEVSVCRASRASVGQRLSGFLSEAEVRSRFSAVCLRGLAEALFAEAVILVEGEEDRSVLEGVAARTLSLGSAGVAVAAANGKRHLLLPSAILGELGIPALLVFDNDSDLSVRMESAGRGRVDVEGATAVARQLNRTIFRYLGLTEEDYPIGLARSCAAALPGNLETFLQSEWPEWAAKLDEIISRGEGARGKNAATYGVATDECSSEPPELLLSVVAAARALARPV